MKLIKHLLFMIFLSLFSFNLYSQEITEEWKLKQQIGIWFGAVTPFPGSQLSDVLNTYLGGGLFYRVNLPFETLKTEVCSSYSYYDSDKTEGLHAIPMYAALSYMLPLELPVSFQAKSGLGAVYLKNNPENNSNTHPMWFSGLEMSFPAGKYVNIGLRADYYFVYEKYLKPPEENPNMKIINGHFFNLGLMVNFNI
ncbi:MAG: hypothetical protein OEZ22_00840 [Spirochaetia bacterium]|nr:hypothetical protein [Spirochaetia bacterium]